jgi:hypothetical protein
MQVKQKNTQWGFLVTRHSYRKVAARAYVCDLAFICSVSQELADLPIVAIDNMPEAIVGWRWYRRRHKAKAYVYSVTQKRSSSP